MSNILIENINFSFDEKSNPLNVLKNLSIQFKNSQSISILGPSGCGKSTLLRCVSGFLTPKSGEILINGDSPSNARINKKIGFAFQEPALLDWKNIETNIKLPESIGKKTMDESEQQKRLSFLLKLTGLENFKYFYPNQLSGGMRQRVSLARSLFTNPKLLLLDEPFAALDLLTRTTLAINLRKIVSEISVPSILVTHSIEEAIIFADRIIILSSLPARILTEIEVKVRVNDIKSLENEEFQDIVSKCRALLLEEWQN